MWGSVILGYCQPTINGRCYYNIYYPLRRENMRRGRGGTSGWGCWEPGGHSFTRLHVRWHNWGTYAQKHGPRVCGLMPCIIWGKFSVIISWILFSASFSCFSPSGTPITRMSDLWCHTCLLYHVLFSLLHLGNLSCARVFEFTTSVHCCVRSIIVKIWKVQTRKNECKKVFS